MTGELWFRSKGTILVCNDCGRAAEPIDQTVAVAIICDLTDRFATLLGPGSTQSPRPQYSLAVDASAARASEMLAAMAGHLLALVGARRRHPGFTRRHQQRPDTGHMRGRAPVRGRAVRKRSPPRLGHPSDDRSVLAWSVQPQPRDRRRDDVGRPTPRRPLPPRRPAHGERRPTKRLFGSSPHRLRILPSRLFVGTPRGRPPGRAGRPGGGRNNLSGDSERQMGTSAGTFLPVETHGGGGIGGGRRTTMTGIDERWALRAQTRRLLVDLGGATAQPGRNRRGPVCPRAVVLPAPRVPLMLYRWVNPTPPGSAR